MDKSVSSKKEFDRGSGSEEYSGVVAQYIVQPSVTWSLVMSPLTETELIEQA